MHGELQSSNSTHGGHKVDIDVNVWSKSYEPLLANTFTANDRILPKYHSRIKKN